MTVSSNSALGLIEVYGFIGAVEGADASLKAASVSLVGVETVKGGITTVMITGDVAAVKAGRSSKSFPFENRDPGQNTCDRQDG